MQDWLTAPETLICMCDWQDQLVWCMQRMVMVWWMFIYISCVIRNVSACSIVHIVGVWSVITSTCQKYECIRCQQSQSPLKMMGATRCLSIHSHCLPKQSILPYFKSPPNSQPGTSCAHIPVTVEPLDASTVTEHIWLVVGNIVAVKCRSDYKLIQRKIDTKKDYWFMIWQQVILIMAFENIM
jgi:hypothetical protein